MMSWMDSWNAPQGAARRLLLGLLVLALLAGCGGSADESAPAPGVGASAATTSAPEPTTPAGSSRPADTAASAPPGEASTPAAIDAQQAADATSTPMPAASEILPPVRAAPGFTAPDFTLKRLDTGEPITLSKLRGKAVWLNFWTTWCEFCQAEAPSMQAVYEQYREAPLVMLGIDVNEEPRIVSRFVEENGLGWTFAVDRGRRVARLYNVVGQPVHVFVAPDGVVDALIIGEMEQAQMEDQVAALLSQAPD